MKKKLLLLILMVLPLFISSCSDDDGKVDPMKWKTELKKSSDGYFHVSPGGGTFVLQFSPKLGEIFSSFISLPPPQNTGME